MITFVASNLSGCKSFRKRNYRVRGTMKHTGRRLRSRFIAPIIFTTRRHLTNDKIAGPAAISLRVCARWIEFIYFFRSNKKCRITLRSEWKKYLSGRDAHVMFMAAKERERVHARRRYFISSTHDHAFLKIYIKNHRIASHCLRDVTARLRFYRSRKIFSFMLHFEPPTTVLV